MGRGYAGFIAVALIACDSVERSGGADSADTGGQDTVFSTWSDGTQIGSEGFWGCVVASRSVVEGDVTLDGFSGSPSELAAPLIGTYVGSVFKTGTDVVQTTLTTSGVSGFELVEVVEAEGCEDYIHVELTSSFAAGEMVSGSFAGGLGLRPSSARLQIHADRQVLDGTAAPITFEASDMSSTTLVVGGDLTSTALDGSLWFVGCASGACVTDASLGTVSLSR